MPNLLYAPPPTVEEFMFNPARVRVLVGPLGSGKSMGCIMELVRRACEQEPYNGVRYTRWACIRNTLQQLRQTVLADLKQYLGNSCSYYATDSTLQLRLSLPDGTRVHSDFMMLPLDTKEDIRRLLSLQLTGGWINECREVDMGIVPALLGRTGRYPSKTMGGATWRGIIADSNPWSTDSEWHQDLVLAPRPGWKLFHQPSGVGPDAENVANLPDHYYSDLMGGRDEDFVAVHVESQWGVSNAGQAVFRRSFNALTHCRDLQMITNPLRPLCLGLDFGRTPSAVICQTDSYGRLFIYKELTSVDMHIHQFIQELLLPALAQAPFVGRKVFIVGDPAGAHKSEMTDETCFDALRSNGLSAYKASTNDVDKRIMAVEKLMRQTIMGQPGLQIDRNGCPTLIKALGDKYRYRKKKDGQLEEVPAKEHPWSDIVDALQYACLGVNMGLVGKVLSRMNPQVGERPYSAKAWT